MVPTYPSEFGDDLREVANDAAEAIRHELPDYEVLVHSPQGAADDFLQIARTLFVDVPWDNIAAMSMMIEALRRWLTRRVRDVKAREARKVDRLEGRPDYF